MRMEELNWMDVETYVKAEDRLMVVLGSCEQHAYLSLLSDTKIPLALADAASQQTGVLVAPALPFGVSPYFADYPGTINLRSDTFLNVVEDVIRSVYHSGFRRILVLNGHGGNSMAKGRLVETANVLPGLKLAWYEWWLAHSVEEVAIRHGLKRTHASWLEAFPFVQVGPLPDTVKTPPVSLGLLNAADTRRIYGDGSFGGPYHVDASIMEEIFSASLADILALLNFME